MTRMKRRLSNQIIIPRWWKMMKKTNNFHITLNYNDEAFFTMFLWEKCDFLFFFFLCRFGFISVKSFVFHLSPSFFFIARKGKTNPNQKKKKNNKYKAKEANTNRLEILTLSFSVIYVEPLALSYQITAKWKKKKSLTNSNNVFQFFFFLRSHANEFLLFNRANF